MQPNHWQDSTTLRTIQSIIMERKPIPYATLHHATLCSILQTVQCMLLTICTKYASTKESNTYYRANHCHGTVGCFCPAGFGAIASLRCCYRQFQKSWKNPECEIRFFDRDSVC